MEVRDNGTDQILKAGRVREICKGSLEGDREHRQNDFAKLPRTENAAISANPLS
jgi:hypothetical protein